MYFIEVKIQKWGNSLGIRISHNIVKELHLEANDIVDVKQKGNQIIVTKLSPKVSLQERIDAYHGENLGKDFVWDESCGKELW